jgi:hypothetical protein
MNQKELEKLKKLQEDLLKEENSKKKVKNKHHAEL